MSKVDDEFYRAIILWERRHDIDNYARIELDNLIQKHRREQAIEE